MPTNRFANTQHISSCCADINSISMPPCRPFNGGIKSIELQIADFDLKNKNGVEGVFVTYYFKRGSKMFFKTSTGNVFIFILPNKKDCPKIKYGQSFMLAYK